MPNQTPTTLANMAVPQTVGSIVWQHKEARRFCIIVSKDDADIISAVVADLPGIGSCGDTEAEAMENVKEAIIEALEVYKSSNESIPWKDPSTVAVPPGGKKRWITLDA